MDPELESQLGPEVEAYIHAQKLILSSSTLDLSALREALDEAGANVQDPDTLVTPLHAAILAALKDEEDGESKGDSQTETEANKEDEKFELDESKIPQVKEAVQLLLENGAIWDDIDANNETPGCLARRIGLTEVYEMIVDAGVRAELLLRMSGYFMLESDDDDDDNDDEDEDMAELAEVNDEADEAGEEEGKADEDTTDQTTQGEVVDPLSNDGYLSKPLPSTLPSGDLIDEDSNAVMMSWETPIMVAHAAALLPEFGKRILNIGHGMGIFDGIVRDNHFPVAHHIIEAHSTVAERMEEAGWKTGHSNYTPETEPNPTSSSRPSGVDVAIHTGKWQSEVPILVEAIKNGTLPPFDAVYYDTFAESYDDFRDFAGHVPELLGGQESNPDAKFGFFFGAGADRQVCYDVYTNIAEMDMRKIGFQISWKDIPVKNLEAEGVWKDVARPYWNIDVYRMPTCSWIDNQKKETEESV